MSTQLRTVRIAAPEGDADREVPEYPGPQHSVIAGVLERALEQRDRDAAILLNGRPELERLGAIRTHCTVGEQRVQHLGGTFDLPCVHQVASRSQRPAGALAAHR